MGLYASQPITDQNNDFTAAIVAHFHLHTNTHTPSSELLAAVFTVGVSLDIEQYVCTAGSYPLGVCFSNCTVVEVVPRF